MQLRRARGAAALLLLLLTVLGACAAPLHSQTAAGDPALVAQLWQAPTDPAARDLFYGPGGKELTPDPTAPYEFLTQDRTGHSPGYDVRSPEGLTWSVKIGDEAQSEVATSRLLWAVGFHQPPTYYVFTWTLSGQEAGPRPAARFRPDRPDRKMVGDWDWYQNPFVGTREFHGLIVANLLLNNWDWKTTNNKIYDLDVETDGARRWYVVRDVGASLGRTRFSSSLYTLFPFLPYGTRNDLPGFESQGFVKGVRDGRVEFDYHGRHTELLESITPADVRWTCELFAKLTDAQLEDAFRAAGYSADEIRRYVAKLREKVAQGLAL